ncbi:MAG: prepilin-type N-terminal cleavage/methylation domain-containing protein [Planctomycetaceae bacterium]|nr:MAG: prepilin-type N-terminal cleavage/methylation domain-containing protein [Planctomycetaceae bacterium]
MTTKVNHVVNSRKAFTLAEILIAIGIMGVGMVMVAALFPAAAKEASVSTEELVGNIICHNSVGAIKGSLWHCPTIGGQPFNSLPINFDGGTQYVPVGLNLVELTAEELNWNGDITTTGVLWADRWTTLGAINKNKTTNYTFNKNSLEYPSIFRYQGTVGASPSTAGITDPNANWIDNQWAGRQYWGSGGKTTIAGNTGNTLTFTGSPGGTPVTTEYYLILDKAPTRYSAVVLGRQYTVGKNDYQFVIVSFSREAVGNDDPVQAELLDSGRDGYAVVAGTQPNTSAIKVNDGALDKLMIGSPVIDLQGNFAKIVSIDRTKKQAELDHVLPAGNQAYVITLRDYLTKNLKGRYSPALSVLVIRTALRQK